MKAIKFNQQGIEAILNGSKTVTRRPTKQAIRSIKDGYIRVGHGLIHHGSVDDFIEKCAKYKVGETVFVQEEFIHSTSTGIIVYKEEACKNLRTDLTQVELLDWKSISWQPASEMQEHKARIFLKITNIKVERLQDISEDDCIKEGVKRKFNDDPDLKGNHISYGEYWILEIDSFRYDIWNNLPYKAPYDWESNPYVFVYEFEK